MRINNTDGQSDITRYVIAIWEGNGKDFSKCEMCLGEIPEGKYEIHHTKYDGATIHDLLVVCHKCNMQSENKGLK